MNGRKKSQIFILLCIISSIIIVLITYKTFNPSPAIPEPNIKEYPVSQSKYLIKQKDILNKITTNFNNKELINKYTNNNVQAIVEGNTIVIKDNNQEKYTFILDDLSLSINITEEANKEFSNIFKIIVEANQQRLGNNDDLSSYFEKNLKNNLITKEIIISKKDNTYEYIINIDKIIKE
ncbi:MAG: hypothetical protein IKF19_03210 [Bacilli bacterium]|nr:hypothetical protein [Bacilli bacterium]